MTQEEILKILKHDGIIPIIELVSDKDFWEMKIWVEQNFKEKKLKLDIQTKLAQHSPAIGLADAQAKFHFAESYLHRINKEKERRSLMPKTEINDYSQKVTVEGHNNAPITQIQSESISGSSIAESTTQVKKPARNIRKILIEIVKWFGVLAAGLITAYIVHKMGWV